MKAKNTMNAESFRERRGVLVTGATGTVGGATARELLRRGAKVRALVRDPERSLGLEGAELALGDLRDEASLDGLLGGMSVAFYVSPHEPDEEELADRFVRACERNGVRLVFVGVHVDAPGRFLRALVRFYFGRLMPSYRPKLRLSERARNSKANPVVLMPTNFFDNDDLFREELLSGAFVQPFERPFNRVAVRDIAEAAARACLEPSFPAGAYPIVGPESLDASACASIWSEVLGRPVAYESDAEVFRSAVLRGAKGKKASDLLSSYSAIRKIRLPTSARDLARTKELLGRAPTNYAEFARERARTWRAS